VIPTAVIDRFAKIVDKEKKMVVRNAPSMAEGRTWAKTFRGKAKVKRPPACAMSFGLIAGGG
jgi:hypothetical protein